MLFLTEDELKVLENKYETDQVYLVNSSTQIFQVTTSRGVLEDKQFNEVINYRKSPAVVLEDLSLIEKGEENPIIDPGTFICDFYTNPVCTPEELEAQHRTLERIYGQFLPRLNSYNFADYPMTLNYIMLCDGSRVLIPTDFLLTLIPGNYHLLDSEVINSPDDQLRVLYRIPDQLFNLKLDYTQNGNIERATWKNTYQSPQYYDYTYDALNRIESATYGVMNNGMPDPSALLNGAYNVSNITYDAIGNILSLDRMAFIDPTTGIAQVDELTYKYGSLDFGEEAAIGNTSQLSRLVAVQDGATGTPASVGFNQGSVGEAENGSNGTVYTYDPAGSMTYDPYKEITIAYNFLNLPEKMGEYDITYDASGRKWQQKSSDEELIYIGGFIFRNEEFASLQLADGRIYKDKLNNDYQSEYHHKDHLGNVRVAFADLNENGRIDLADAASGEVTQMNNYYPFGMVHPQSCVPDGVVGNDNLHKFNGIEHLDKVGIDLAPFRGYDAAIGRWLHVDPIHKFHESGYASMANNPVLLADPMGLDTIAPDPTVLPEAEVVAPKEERGEAPVLVPVPVPLPSVTPPPPSTVQPITPHVPNKSPNRIGFIPSVGLKILTATALVLMPGDMAKSDMPIYNIREYSPPPSGDYAVVRHIDKLPRPGHFTIDVHSEGSVISTHQIMLDALGTNTTVVEVSSSFLLRVKNIRSASFWIPLPNGPGAQAYQRSVIGMPGGEYHEGMNSCLTHVCNVLGAGGIPVTGSWRKQMVEARRIFREIYNGN